MEIFMPTPTKSVEAQDGQKVVIPVQNAEDRAALVSKVDAGLQDVFTGDDAPSDVEEPATPETPAAEPDAEPVVEPEPEPEPEGDEPDGEDPEPEPEPEPVQAAAAPKSGTPTLPAAQRRSLKSRGWSDEEIDGLYKADPGLMLKTADRIHQSRVEEMAGWADLGRQARKGPEAKPDVTPAAAPAVAIGLIDEEALIKQYGNEEIVHAIAAPVNEILRQINVILPDIRQGAETVKRTREQVLGRQIDDFFASEDLKAYVEFYGKPGIGLTDEHRTRRNSVVETADAMVAGAMLQNRRLTVDEALDLAHAAVSRDFQIKAIRTKITKDTKTRSKGITLKPNTRTAKADDRSKDRKALEARVNQGLKAVYG
jgi:hypothetical protein